jgi:hypothetical protein
MRPYNNSSNRSRRATTTTTGRKRQLRRRRSSWRNKPCLSGSSRQFHTVHSYISFPGPSLFSSYSLLTHCPSWSDVVVWTGNKIILGTVEVSDAVVWMGNKISLHTIEVSDVVLWSGNKDFHLLSRCQTLISGNREWDTFTTCPSVKHISVNGE